MLIKQSIKKLTQNFCVSFLRPLQIIFSLDFYTGTAAEHSKPVLQRAADILFAFFPIHILPLRLQHHSRDMHTCVVTIKVISGQSENIERRQIL